MSLTKKIFFNTSAQFIGKVANTVLGLASVALITRYLGVAGYGNYTTAFAYIMFFSVISDFGFFWVIVRKISVGEKVEVVIQNAQTLRIIFAGIVLAAALILVGFLPYDTELKTAIIMVAISIFWMGQNSVYLALFQSQLKMQWPVIAETCGRVMSLGLVLLAIYFKLGFLWIVAAGLSATLLNYILNLIFSLKYSPFGFRFDRPIVKNILYESLPIGVVTILSLVYFKIDTIFLSVITTSTDVGIYGTAYKILEILMALPVMFVGTIFPALSEAFSRQDHDRLQKLVQKSFDILSIGAFGIGAFFFGFARPIINLVAGKDYLDTATVSISSHPIAADIVLQILIIAVLINFFNCLFTNSLITFKHQKDLIKPYVIATIFNVVANIIFIPHYSYVAAASTTVITELIILILTFPLVIKLTNIKLNIPTFIKSAFAGILFLLIATVFRNLNFFLSASIATCVFIITLFLTNAFSFDTLKKLYKD